MSSSCVKHPMTVGDSICSGCGHSFCRECIVHPFGVDKPGLCISCALERGGVRSRATKWPRLPRKTVKQRLRSARRPSGIATPDDDRTMVDPPLDADADHPLDPIEQWIGDDGPIEAIPGAWSETYG